MSEKYSLNEITYSFIVSYMWRVVWHNKWTEQPLHKKKQRDLTSKSYCWSPNLLGTWCLGAATISSSGFRYGLPHPLNLLEDPPPREKWKNLVKLKFTEYWQNIFTQEALSRPFLCYFSPQMHFLRKPSTITSACLGGGSEPKCWHCWYMGKGRGGRVET